MLTAWGKKMMQLVFTESSNGIKSARPAALGTAYSSRPTWIEGKDYAGNTKYFTGCTNAAPQLGYISGSINAYSSGFAIGSGDAAESENSHSIESKINGTSGSVSPDGYGWSAAYDSVTGKFSLFKDITVTNNNAESITVKEIAFFLTMFDTTTEGATPTSSSSYDSTLIDRTLLENPITIPAGESAVIRYEFDIDMSDD